MSNERIFVPVEADEFDAFTTFADRTAEVAAASGYLAHRCFEGAQADGSASEEIARISGHVITETESLHSLAEKMRDICGRAEAIDQSMIGNSVAFTLTTQERDLFNQDLSEAGYLLKQAARVFDLMRMGLSSGFLEETDGGVYALCELLNRAFKHASQNEGERLDEWAVRIGKAG